MFPKKGMSTIKQMAYAKQILGANGKNKKQIALDVGYSANVANSVMSHIENKPGFNNAMMKLAYESNNLALAAMHEFKARGFADFTNNELIGSLNAIAGAWSKFNMEPRQNPSDSSKNRLRTVILQRVEQQNITTNESIGIKEVEKLPTDTAGDPNDF